MGSLEEVSMPQNGIRADGITALADGLAANHNLHSINLNDNTFTEKGAEAMAQVRRGTSLKDFLTGFSHVVDQPKWKFSLSSALFVNSRHLCYINSP